MTEVLTATSGSDPLRNNRLMATHDDHISFNSNTDWRAKYMEAADMLAETRAELDEFQRSSKELEEELERELELTERAQEDLKAKVNRAESEREEWKTKFMSLQTTHNTTTTSLQKELDTLRQSHQQLMRQMRELEIGNDDLERSERAVSSSLADVEAKYARALEEKILLEQELLDKATLEEECQRLKDELRDTTEEAAVLKEQLTEARSNAHLSVPSTSSLPPLPSRNSSEDSASLLRTPPPPDLLLSDLTRTQTNSSQASEPTTPSTPPTAKAQLPAAGFLAPSTMLLRATGLGSNSLARSNSVPTASPSRLPMRESIRQTPRPALNASQRTITGSSTASKSKGVQMVSEMRARVRTLEQKLHSRVPRLRMGSLSGRLTNNSSSDSLSRDQQTPTQASKGKAVAESPGWVLVMEESSPPKPRRSADSTGSSEGSRTSSHSGPTAFRMAQNGTGLTAPSPTPGSGARRPISRLSASTDGRSSIGSTTSSTMSSIPTPTSRPATPTFLPVPTSQSSALRKSVGTGLAVSGRRSSLGLGAATPPLTHTSPLPPTTRTKERPTSVPGLPRNGPAPLDKSQATRSKELPSVPPSTSIPNPLAQSRIGRPKSFGLGFGGRKPAPTDTTQPADAGRPRAGSVDTGSY